MDLIHAETQTALQIILTTGEFKSGEYQCSEYEIDWVYVGPSKESVLRKTIEGMHTTDLYSLLCQAEGINEEEAVDRTIQAIDHDDLERLLDRLGYPISEKGDQ